MTLQLTIGPPSSMHDDMERRATLLGVLTEKTRTTWRWASANVAVEKTEPYRVAVLRGPMWRTWCDWCSNPHALDCQIEVALYTPLA